MILEYFGTSLTTAGHYFFQLSGDYMGSSRRKFGNTIFNAEYDIPGGVKLGHVCLYQCGNYSILRIEGSCYDKRGGCKSVFFVQSIITWEELSDLIKNTPIAMKIIQQMPFEVNIEPPTKQR